MTYGISGNKKNNYIYILGIIIYRIIYDYVYSSLICKYYFSSGLMVRANTSYIIYSYFFIVVLGFSFKKVLSLKNPSGILVYLLYLFSAIPVSSYWCFNEVSFQYVLVSSSYWIIFIFLSVIVLGRMVDNNISIKFCGDRPLFLFVIYFTELTILVLAIYSKTFIINFDLFMVYKYREQSLNANLPTIAWYVFPWAANVILPIAIYYFHTKKKKLQVVFSIFCQLLVFTITGMKTYLFILPIIFLVIMLNHEVNFKNISLAFAFVCLLMVFEYVILGTNYLTVFIGRRTLNMPAQLNYYFYDYFSSNAPDMYRQGILGKLGFDSPYSIEIPHLISKIYYGLPLMAANNGLLGDAMANWGVIGIFVSPAIIVFCAKLLDVAYSNKEVKGIFPSLVAMAMAMVNSSINGVLSTHGFFVLILFGILYPVEEDKVTIQG